MDLIASPYLLAAIFAITFFGMGGIEERAGEKNHGLLWAACSAALSLVALRLFDISWTWLFIVQIGLLLAIAIFRAARDP
jgi:hypothetical protein